MLILIAGVSFVAAASELVTNGDFSNSLTGWGTEGVGTAAIDNGCGPGVAKFTIDNSGSAGSATGALTQCVVVDANTQPNETYWTLFADLRLISGFVTGVAAHFYNNPNCSGGSPAKIIDFGTFTPSGSLAPFTETDDYTPPPNSSVKLVASLGVVGFQTAEACFDNISLNASVPAAVALGSIDVQNGTPSPWAIVLLLAAAAIMIATFVIVGRRILSLDA